MQRCPHSDPNCRKRRDGDGGGGGEGSGDIGLGGGGGEGVEVIFSELSNIQRA
tara:strand:+ start:77 stop:235 length:159 start_codon:yes stop_codon:yes gene_type:complete